MDEKPKPDQPKEEKPVKVVNCNVYLGTPAGVIQVTNEINGVRYYIYRC